MRGLLKSKSPLNHFLLLVSIALASLFIIGFVGTLVLSKITGIDIVTMSDSSKWKYNDGNVVTMIRGMQIIQFVSLFLLPSFLCARLFSTDTKKYLGLRLPAHSGYFIAAAAMMLLAIPMVNFLGELNRNVRFPAGMASWMQEQEAEAAKSIKALLSKHTIKDLMLNIICIAGLAAVGEELLFRGIAQRLLIRIFKSPVAGIVIAAFLFSAMHIQFYGFLPRFVLGILLGFIYWYSGSLWVSVIAHFVYDAFLIVVVYYSPASLNDENALQLSNLALAGAVSCAIVAALFVWMKKKSTTTFSEVYADDLIPVKDHPF